MDDATAFAKAGIDTARMLGNRIKELEQELEHQKLATREARNDRDRYLKELERYKAFVKERGIEHLIVR